MREFKRTDRVADQIQRELAQMIQQEIKDPRLDALVTVSGVKVSKDLGYADVYVTILGKEDKPQIIADNLHILQHAAGFMRSQLGQRIKLRVMPQLRFHYDETLVRGRHLSSLIDQAVQADQSRQQDDQA
ncbi:ribosome-binding factor A [Allopseudospirillum japonicum]|uniref:Ribosome-binding factor A n=1 Tax=Allopseudospirillum japonicum TaxID=64971 RepID=A0A1H6QLF6_9GAMM|nr:30S ribosome-binding factor RbfA [Allopseudospirillum japonicum]SEI44591.1 ribosome-binding factor A [Allopseudospirillum japonicum]